MQLQRVVYLLCIESGKQINYITRVLEYMYFDQHNAEQLQRYNTRYCIITTIHFTLLSHIYKNRVVYSTLCYYEL